jgi:hypothetical protein
MSGEVMADADSRFVVVFSALNSRFFSVLIIYFLGLVFP